MAIEQPYYTVIYNILRSRLSDQDKVNKVACWVIDNPNINRTKFASSFKRAERKDLLDLFIEDEDIKIGERIKIKSYATQYVIDSTETFSPFVSSKLAIPPSC